jgi:hypothetical protein
MPLSPDECRSVFPIAWGLPPDRTADFVREVEAALARHPAVRGEGVAYRVAVELLPRYFTPPPMSAPQFFNAKKSWLRPV